MGPKHGGRGGAGGDAVDMDTRELQLGFAGPPQPSLCLRILQSSSRVKWEGSWGFREKDSCLPVVRNWLWDPVTGTPPLGN